MPTTPLASGARRGPRLRMLALAAGIVVGVHAWLLLQLAPDVQPVGVAAPDRPAAMTLLAQRGVAAAAPVPITVSKPEATSPPQAGAKPGSAVPAAAVRRAASPRAASDPLTLGLVRTTAPAEAPADASFAVPPKPAAESSAATPAPAAGGESPVYATRLPPSMRLHYRLRRGDSLGSATLHWQLDADGYRLSLDGELDGKPTLASTSLGSIDAAGIAPLRHAERRRSREVRAVNFQRQAGLISFSGPQAQYPLHPGAQDRSSWLVQLPAIVEASPALGERGVTLFVAGTRGDAEAWHFEPQGREDAGPVVQALHLRREPARPYDSRVDVWLDPARGHLPVRLRFTTVPGGVPLEMELDAVEPGA